jgi:hypothetical protein
MACFSKGPASVVDKGFISAVAPPSGLGYGFATIWVDPPRAPSQGSVFFCLVSKKATQKRPPTANSHPLWSFLSCLFPTLSCPVSMNSALLR